MKKKRRREVKMLWKNRKFRKLGLEVCFSNGKFAGGLEGYSNFEFVVGINE